MITGDARGVPMATLPGEDVRPTSQRVKEAMFSAIQFEISGRRVLDAFAGSGQLGVEALSRGAGSCLFLDLDGKALAMVKQNITRAKLLGKAKLMQVDAVQYMRRAMEGFGLIFLDPPYGSQLLHAAIPAAAELLGEDGVLVCEAPAQASLPEQCGGVPLRKEYRYGKTKILVYRKMKDEMI